MAENFDLVVLGGGSGGLVVAAVAAQLGYRVALLEGGKMGGDCLNYGCVPSKALIAAAKIAHTPKKSEAFGITLTSRVDFKRVMAHVQDVIAHIAPHDSVERFKSLGCTVIQEYGHFTSPTTVATPGGRSLTARRFVIATGSRAALPPIKGLAEVPYLTNETLFSLKEQPAHLAIIGGGPIGIEMAQAFRRLGSKVTVFEGASRILARDDPTLTTLLYDQLKAEGVTFHTGLFVDRITPATSGLDLHFNTDGHTQVLSASHLLVAAGRTPNIEQLGLPAADIKHGKTGIQVNGQLRTSNPRVYAVGDVAGPYLFTHMAAEQATLFIKRVLFGNVLAKGQPTPVPWVTYTDPELAHIGLTWEEAQRKYGNKLGITELATAEVDRYVAERRTEGKIRVFTAPGGKVVGVNILAAQAGELLPVWGLIIQQGLKLSALSSVIHPYPTMGELNKRIASKYYSGMLYAPRTGRLSRLLFRLLG